MKAVKRGRGRPKLLQGAAQNVNLHLETEICEKIDEAVRSGSGQYKNRSDFIREAIRARLASVSPERPSKKQTDFTLEMVGRTSDGQLEYQEVERNRRGEPRLSGKKRLQKISQKGKLR